MRLEILDLSLTYLNADINLFKFDYYEQMLLNGLKWLPACKYSEYFFESSS